jgi:hypothetical protein
MLIAHPFWFQSFGAVMGMDWHSSGITTRVVGALKRGLAPDFHSGKTFDFRTGLFRRQFLNRSMERACARNGGPCVGVRVEGSAREFTRA